MASFCKVAIFLFPSKIYVSGQSEWTQKDQTILGGLNHMTNDVKCCFASLLTGRNILCLHHILPKQIRLCEINFSILTFYLKDVSVI